MVHKLVLIDESCIVEGTQYVQHIYLQEALGYTAPSTNICIKFLHSYISMFPVI